MKTSIMVTVGVFFLTNTSAFAAEQGQVGSSSSATISMTITINPHFAVNHNAAAFKSSGDPRHLPVTANFDGGYKVEKIEVEPRAEGRVKDQAISPRSTIRKPTEKRYAYVIIPSVQ